MAEVCRLSVKSLVSEDQAKKVTWSHKVTLKNKKQLPTQRERTTDDAPVLEEGPGYRGALWPTYHYVIRRRWRHAVVADCACVALNSSARIIWSSGGRTISLTATEVVEGVCTRFVFPRMWHQNFPDRNLTFYLNL